MNYPSIKEYKEAILFAEDNFEQLKNLRPVLEDDGSPVMTSGNFAVVFKMKDEQTGKLHAVKCFLREQEGRAEAYQQIAEELEYVSSTFLTPIKYLDKELFVDTNASDDTEFSVLLMDWVEGDTLDKYIRKHLDDQYELSLLAYQFSRLAMWLMPQPFAHGDLKPDNILVKSDGTLVLVDYDGMYVPAMKGQKARELGSPDFRHPGRTEEVFDDHIDDFSLASILLSLKAIALQPSLLEEYGASDRLLFSEKDYRNLSGSSALGALQPLMQDAELASLYSLYILALSQNNLSQVSFRLFNLSRPDKSQYDEENLSTEVTEEDLANAWTDEYGVKYSADRKRLLKAPSNLINYCVHEGTKVICNEAFYNIEIVSRWGKANWEYEYEETNYISKLETITLPTTLKVIGDSAFSDCHSLTSIILPRSVKNVGKSVFSGCINLESAIFCNGIIEIGEATFRNCKNLSSFIIPNGVRTIRKNMFRNCDKLVSVVIPEGIEIIEESAFYSSKNLKSATLPDSIVEIGDCAFLGCSQLETVSFPKKLTTIGKSSFLSCRSLKSIFIPASVAIIKEYAFKYCINLHSIIVSDENCSYDSRNNCNAIIETNSHTLIVGCVNTVIPDGVLKIGKESFYSVKDLSSVVIPSSTETIEDYAFSYCEGINSIIIPQNVMAIGEATFFGCTGLKSVIIKNSKIRLGERVFHECVNLAKIEIAQSDIDRFVLYDYGNKYAESNESGLSLIDIKTEVAEAEIANAWVDECGAKYSQDRKRLLWVPRSLTDYSIRKNTRIICNYSFMGCEELTKIFVPDGVRAIGFCAFKNCKSLSTVSVPNTVIKLGSSSFEGCSRLTRLELPDSIKTIGKYVFMDCVNLSSIALPNHIEKIEERTFSGCHELSCIEIPDSVAEIKEGAFAGCKKIASIHIPKSVKIIGDLVFSDCESLSSVEISDGVSQLGGFLFARCKSLRSIFIPNSITKLDGFDPDGWTIRTFDKCNSLRSIYIPKGSKEKFEKLLPKHKDKLVEQNEDERLSTEVTDEDLANAWTDEYGVKYSKDKKRLLGVYSSYLPDYDIPEGTKVICDDSLNGIWQETDGLMISGKITIPSTVQNIGRNPFRGDYDTIICNSPYFVVEDDALYSVDKKRLIACFHKGFDFVVPDSVEEIGDFAFYACCIYCIKIPKSVSHIGDNPFVDAEINNVIIDNDSCYYYEENGALYRRNPQELVACWGKQNLLFVDENTTKIGPFAFWNGIERIGLPDSIRKISESAFYGYGAKPKQIYIPENSPIRFENLIIYNNKSGGEILKYVQDESGVIYSKDGKILLKAPKNIVEYNIKEDAIVIDNNAFSWCKELVNIKLSSSIKRIGERVFWCCRSLEQMIIPDSVMEIGIEAFAGCNSLKQIVIPNSITSIPNRAFSSCSSLMSISIPISVTHIGEFAFEDCNSLETISLPESVSSIGKDAFQDCWNLRQISIPKSITKISECTFLRCISLIQVIIPDSVEIIENGAFMECTKLQSISLPVGIKSINDETFDACYNLDEIVIPSNVESIGAYAFVRCRKLNKLWLSDNVTFIDPSAFNGCVKLEYIFIPDNTFVKFEKLLPEYREIMMEKVIIDNHEGLRRVFGKKEIESVNKAEVVRSALTNSVCFCMNDGCQKYIPLSKDSKLSIGDSIDLKIAKLIEFTDEGIYYGFDGYGEYYSKYLVEA